MHSHTNNVRTKIEQQEEDAERKTKVRELFHTQVAKLRAWEMGNWMKRWLPPVGEGDGELFCLEKPWKGEGANHESLWVL